MYDDAYCSADADFEFLRHYGIKRRSGRYPWGSGEDPFQHDSNEVLRTINRLKDQGFSEIDIRTALGRVDDKTGEVIPLTSGEYKALYSIAVNENKQIMRQRAKELDAEVDANGKRLYSRREIGEMLAEYNDGKPVIESTVREMIKHEQKGSGNKIVDTADFLEEQLKVKPYIDISQGAEREIVLKDGDEVISIGVTATRLEQASRYLQSKGYEEYTYYIPQATDKTKNTTMVVLCPPGSLYSEVYKDRANIKSIGDYETSEQMSDLGIKPPTSISSDRVYIRYNEEGGKAKDGVIELRRGVEDISLGDSHYAQVRIGVDGTHYMKGMAIYSNDIPDGYDIVYNSNKLVGTPANKVFKAMKTTIDNSGGEVIDPVNPFGAAIKVHGQVYYDDPKGIYINPETGNKASISVCNKIKEEGDWDHYSKNLASQMLSKQSPELAKRQLDLTYNDKLEEFDQICSLTNPTVKKKLLQTFSDSCDSASVNLKAAAVPGQLSQVILPLTNIKDNEIYAPNFKNGEQVALIRYPHGGLFEIPILKVNNRNEQGIDIIGNAKDAVGINGKVAEQLSGADFDGDTVVVIPLRNGLRINHADALKELKNFDPEKEYPGYPGMRVMDDGREKQIEMGKISNLITDMTIMGAPTDEIARAVKHSMVVIDAPKHEYDWKKSERDNGIAELKTKYQGGPNAGAATIISRAKGEYHENDRKPGVKIVDESTGKTKVYYIDPVTGEKLYTYTGATYNRYKKNDDGTIDIVKANIPLKTTITKMESVKDAHDLTSGPKGTPGAKIEEIYADHANNMKNLGNRARLEMINTGKLEYSKEANKRYSTEVASLNSKLNDALKNAPRERQAQLYADAVISAKKASNPELKNDKDRLNKEAQMALQQGRTKYGANRQGVIINVEPKEWEAIQSGAISDHKLKQILDNSDMTKITEYAMPKATNDISSSKQALIRSMNLSHYSISEIAERVGCSTSTVRNYI